MIIFERLVILGVGLMGGSLALAAKQAGVVGTVVGWSRTDATLQSALANGVIDEAQSDLSTALVDADCVVVATPTILAESVMQQVLEQVPVATAVTDVASVKGNIAGSLNAHFGFIPPNAILGHPIAGSEHSGVAAANVDLYQNHRVILINQASTVQYTNAGLLAKVSQLWRAVGAEVSTMTAEDHDRILALTSHLPHFLAYAIVAQLSAADDALDVFNFAAGGLRDFTRIASSDPRMWREILLANKTELTNALDGFEQQVLHLRALVAAEDGQGLEDIFSDVKHSRDKFVAALAARNDRSKS